jgi:hypothetical protein
MVNLSIILKLIFSYPESLQNKMAGSCSNLAFSFWLLVFSYWLPLLAFSRWLRGRSRWYFSFFIFKHFNFQLLTFNF